MFDTSKARMSWIEIEAMNRHQEEVASDELAPLMMRLMLKLTFCACVAAIVWYPILCLDHFCQVAREAIGLGALR